MNTSISPEIARPRRLQTHRLRTYPYAFHSRASHFLPMEDRHIAGNRDFSYQLMKVDDGRPASRLILLLHGFNEKSWDKYRSWGEHICRETGSAVLFFPIAFHMQRAPESWSSRREMYRLSESRRTSFSGIRCSSLSNAAISHRIQENPERLIRGGLESYYDVLQFLMECREGRVDQLRPDFSLDLFGYSIGGLLAEILKLSNPGGLFTHSRVCLFCSGPVFKRLSPVSRYILDSEANRVLQNFLSGDPRSRLSPMDESIRNTFISLLDYHFLPDFREKKLRENAGDFYAIVLKKDLVIPSSEVFRTLQGADGSIAIRVDELDFPYSYSHENPFSSGKDSQKEAASAFGEVFRRFCLFLKKEQA